jgi:endonuclease/exonuclease/phosphatase family metal-dependent hydrolase
MTRLSSKQMGKGLRDFILLAWVAGLLLVGLIQAVGTGFAWLAPLVFAPPLAWPMAFVFLAAFGSLISAWRCVVGLLLTAAFLAGPWLGWRSHRAAHPPIAAAEAADAAVLRVVSWNQGQHYDHSISPFLVQMQPDVVAFQDAALVRRVAPATPGLRAYEHTTNVGEFMLASRFPILSVKLVPNLLPLASKRTHFSTEAARFCIDFHGQPVVIYSIHVLSPRFALDDALGLEKDMPYKQPGDSSFWPMQHALIEQLIAHIEAETLPTVVLGDWNMPPLGPLYRQMTRHFVDAHAQVGLGYGFTCPGDMWTPFSLGQPWLRIDYILGSPRWEPLDCFTEAGGKAQHRAIAGVLRLR